MHSRKQLSILTIIAYLIMIVVNALANILPINGVGTGEVSDKYVNLFAPAGYVFLIWVVIYILLGMYCFYQFNLFSRRSDMSDRVILRVNQYFLLSSLLNSAWIFAWHFEKIGISLILMLGIFYLLLQARITITQRSTPTHDEKISVKLPFSVYFGWITIATIANITTFLVSRSWDRFGIREDIITSIILVIGALIGIIATLKWLDIPFGLVFLWAYCGILFKHISTKGFAGSYPMIIISLIVILSVISITLVYVLYRTIKTQKSRKDLLHQSVYSPKNFESVEFQDDIEI